jgi:hypothetical protein
VRLSVTTLALLGVLLIASVASSQRRVDRKPNSGSWEGTYTFVEKGGRTAGATPIVVEHKIKIYRVANHLLADIDADGFQTSVALTCDTSVSGNKINLYYQKRREGDTGSQTIDQQDRVKDRYNAGQLMLVLEKSLLAGTHRILTHWHGYQPVEIRPRNGKVYFRKEV